MNRINQIKGIEIILYVRDQSLSTLFYRKIFRKDPELHVEGMTAFTLTDQCIVGLMPNKGIATILSHHMPHPDTGFGIPRCELYLHVDNLEWEYENAIQSGAKLISPILERNWGDKVCYFSDPDGHILAFAKKIMP